MAAEFQLYNGFRLNLAKGAFDLSGNIWRVNLYKTIIGVSDNTFSVMSEITGAEVANGFGYTTNGVSTEFLSLLVSSTTTVKWDLSDVFWSASGGTIESIRSFVLYESNATQANSQLIGWGQISDSSTSIADTNRLTIQWAADGVIHIV